MFQRKKGFVSVWIGQGLKKTEFEGYAVDEVGDADETPLNEFARDAGDVGFDHDFVAAEWRGTKNVSIEQALNGYMHGDLFVGEAAQSAKKKKIATANAAVVMYDSILRPARWPKRSPLTFLGDFAYQEAKPDVPPPERRKDDHTKHVSTVSISPDSSFGVSFGYDDTMRLWDLKHGRLIAKKKVGHDFVGWLPDSTRFITELSYKDSGHGFVVWQATSTALTKKKYLKTDGSVSAQLSPDGTQLVWVKKAPVVGNIRDWNPAEQPDPKDWIESTQILPGNRVVAVDIKGNYRLWSLETNKVLSKFAARLSKWATAPQILGCCREHEIVAQVPTSGRLMLIDIGKGKVIRQLKSPLRLDNSAILGHGSDSQLAGIGGSTVQGMIRSWCLRTGRLTCRADIDEINVIGAIAVDAGTVATASHHANLHVWDLSSGKRKVTWRVAPDNREVEPELDDGDGHEMTAVAVSADGKTIMVGEHSGRVFILRLDRGKLKRLR